MPRPALPRPAGRALLGALALALTLALAPAGAQAWPGEHDRLARRATHHRHPDAVRFHGPPRPGIVSGYLPRNNSVPMYNEPPRRPPAW